MHFLAATDDQLYFLMEMLPDYETLSVDEATYIKERSKLVTS